MSSTWPSSVSVPRDGRSTRAARASSSPVDPRGSWSDAPTSTRRSDGCSAYAEAGADCLYAPRIDTVEHVAAIVAAVSPKPVNLLINAPFITVAEAADLGVRRISVGGTLARTAWAGFLRAAQEIAGTGTFSRFEGCRTSMRCSALASREAEPAGALASGVVAAGRNLTDTQVQVVYRPVNYGTIERRTRTHHRERFLALVSPELRRRGSERDLRRRGRAEGELLPLLPLEDGPCRGRRRRGRAAVPTDIVAGLLEDPDVPPLERSRSWSSTTTSSRSPTRTRPGTSGDARSATSQSRCRPRRRCSASD